MQLRRTITKQDINDLIKHIPQEVKQKLVETENPYELELSYINVPAEYNSWDKKRRDEFLISRCQAKCDNIVKLEEMGFTLQTHGKHQWYSPEGTPCNPIPPDEPLPD
jgi:hypothetical protein